MKNGPLPASTIPADRSQNRKVSHRYMRERWQRFLSQDKNGMMMIEGVSVEEIVKKYGSPLYVMVESEIRDRCRRFKKVFGPDIGLQYAVKCNSNLEILRTVREEGFDLDCSSVGEVILGLLADFKPKQITLTNLYKSEQDLHFAAKMDIQAITADSLEEIEHIAATAKKLKKHIDLMIRVNPMLEVGNYSTRGNKYGIPIGYIDRAVDLARRSPFVDFQGFHFMGGYVYHTRVFKAAARTFVKLIKRCQDRGVRVKRLSLGGGFPAAIGDQEAFPIEDMKDFPQYFKNLLDRNGIQPLTLMFEPGKSIVLNAGIGLMRVIAKKRLGKSSRMVLADGSTYNFVPDALVQGADIKYDILPASKLNTPRIHTVTIAGNTCDCWDLIARGIDMPKLRAGDLLAIMDVGGYAQVMSSNFNTLKRAGMVMIDQNGNIRQIRRRDRYSEMFAPELDVLKLAGPDELEFYNNLYRVNIDKIWKGGGMHALSKKQKNGNGNAVANGDSDGRSESENGRG
jgi:diaminopimelate decarboxylase